MQTLSSKNAPKSNYARVEARKRALRIRILKESLNLFSRFGLDGTSIAQIVKQSDTSVGAFYGLFDSKATLYQSLIDEALVPVVDLIEDLYDNETEPLATLSSGLRITLEVSRQYPDWGNFVARHTLVAEESQSEMIAHLQRDIARAKQLNQVGDMDELLLLAIVVGTFLSGTAFASQNLLSKDMATQLTARCLVGMGVSETVAADLVLCDLSDAAFKSPLVGFDPGA